jgi:DNA-3-methyladenine glycosylase II
MSGKQAAESPDWTSAIAHLRRDPVMRKLIERVGRCTLAPRGEPFGALCNAIFSQQLSTIVAKVLFGRFCKLFPRGKPTPRGVLKILRDGDPSCARGCGLSRAKHKYIVDLAEHFASRKVPIRAFGKRSDEEIIQALVPIKGVGRWTAEMFLIFVLNRPNLLPVDDLGLRKGVQKFYSLRREPKAKQLNKIAKAWEPYRSIGTWYIWRGLGLEAAKKKGT